MSFVDPAHVQRSMFDVLVERRPIAEVIVPTQIANLDLAPARISLAKLEIVAGRGVRCPLPAQGPAPDVMPRLRVHRHRHAADARPDHGQRHGGRTHLLIPIQSSYFALEGTDDLLETMEKIKVRANPDLQLLGRARSRSTTAARCWPRHPAADHQVFGDKVFRTIVTRSVRLEESPAYRVSIFEHAPQSTGAVEYYALCEEVIARV